MDAPSSLRSGKTRRSGARRAVSGFTETILRLLSEGWRWRYTQHGRVAHAIRPNRDVAMCGAANWRKAAPSPETADAQHTKTVFCQRCVGRIVREAQEQRHEH